MSARKKTPPRPTRTAGGGLGHTHGWATSCLIGHGVERRAGKLGGVPLVPGSRVPTAQVREAFMRGLSIDLIAGELGLERSLVEASIRFEACVRARAPWALQIARARIPRGADGWAMAR